MASRTFISPHLTFPLSSSSSSSTITSTRRFSFGASRKRPTTIADASSGNNGGTDDDNTPSFNPFGFVTDNPSSRSAIQLPESPAEDGNVGQMLYWGLEGVARGFCHLFHFAVKEKKIFWARDSSMNARIEDKGKEYGRYIRSGDLVWFVRQTGSLDSRRGTIVFLHGAPTQSYSYRVVMEQMSESGFHCIAPDWIGFGFSEKPQPGYGFDYTEKEFHDELDKLLEIIGVASPFLLVVQGFLVGSYGLTWALKNPSKIIKLGILNTPLTPSSPVPGLFQKLRIPFYGEFTSQNAVMAERFIEAGSPYVLKIEKADVYRLPYLESSGPGFALLEAARKINFREVSTQIAAGFASGSWDKPILVAWGMSDKYLPQSIVEEFQKGNPSLVKLKLIEGAGHMPQEDWPEKVVDALRAFF